MVDMHGTPVSEGDVVQIDPTYDDGKFGGCFAFVDELKPGWNGLQVGIPYHDSGIAYYRVPADRVVYVGSSEWAIQ